MRAQARSGHSHASCIPEGRRRGGSIGLGFSLLGRQYEPLDQIMIRAFGFTLVFFEFSNQFLDSIDGKQDQIHGVAGDGRTVPQFAHQCFGCVRERLEARQTQKAAGTLDRVDKAKNVRKNCDVVGLLLKTHELDVDHVEAFVRLVEKIPQQFVHCSSP
jgi:hypothetical protein